MSKLRIVMDGHGCGRVWLDDAELKVVKLKVEVGVGLANRATLVLTPDEIEVEGEHDVTTIGDASRKFAAGKET